MALFEEYAANQAEAQTAGRHYVGKQALDFTPFEAALGAFAPERAAWLAEHLTEATAAGIAALLASGQTTSAELVTYYVERIRRIDADRHNAVMELNPDALAIAAGLDDERAAGHLRGPLHGIPVMLKGNIATGDRMHTSAGAFVLRDARADRDAFLVAALRTAGMVILGKNNLSEWANYYATRSVNGFSVLGGFTRNPHGKFDVGGSSSGSCAAVALGLTPLSIGSETTGSIVYPASQNGVVGLKPSVGLISRDRIIPISDAYDTAGPISRTVADVAALMTILAAQADPTDGAAHDVDDQAGRDFTAGLSPDALHGVRVGLVLPATIFRTGDEIIRAQVAARLQAAGATVIDIPAMEEFCGKDRADALHGDNAAILSRGFRLGVEAYLDSQRGHVPVSTLAEIVAFNEADPANRIPFGQEYLIGAAAVTPEQLAGYPELAARTVAAYGKIIREALTTHDVAFMADFSNYASPYHSRAGFPALTLPAGRRETGEPLGITFFGERFADADLLRWGYAFEHAPSAES